jgi:hypothetical protein
MRRALDATRHLHIRESFERFDEGGKGWLCRAELKCAMASLMGYRPPRVEVQLLLEQANEGQVGFELFRPAMEVSAPFHALSYSYARLCGGSSAEPPVYILLSSATHKLAPYTHLRGQALHCKGKGELCAPSPHRLPHRPDRARV